MNIDTLRNAGIDYDYGVERFTGNAPLFENVLDMFTKDSTFPHLSEAYAARNMDKLFSAVHEFKGMCGNIGLTALYERACTLTELLRGGAYTGEELSEAYGLLEKEYLTVCEAVRSATEVTV